MMKRYSNNSVEMRTLYFTDGTAVFMFRGQVFETDKDVTHVPDGVRVKDLGEPISRKRKSSKPQDTIEDSASEDLE